MMQKLKAVRVTKAGVPDTKEIWKIKLLSKHRREPVEGIKHWINSVSILKLMSSASIPQHPPNVRIDQRQRCEAKRGIL
jgi:hypothetical protein